MLHSVEFYVILAIVAAAIVAFAAKPRARGPVREMKIRGDLLPAMPGDPRLPQLVCRCMNDGRVMLLRNGLNGVYSSGAVELAIELSEFDITISERISPGSPYDGGDIADAMFVLDFLASGEYYHIKYTNDKLGLFAAFTLHVRPGIASAHELRVNS